MTLKILAQNALDAFSDPKTADEFIGLVDRLRPDVAIFPEAYDVDRPQGVDGAMEQLMALGYEVLHGPYDDTDGRKDRHGTVLLIRKELVNPKKPGGLTRIGSRNIVESWVVDPTVGTEVHIVGVHLNDRSEAKRQVELDDLLGGIVHDDEPTIIAGDLNAIHRTDARGSRIWLARCLAALVRLHLFPATEPTRSLNIKNDLGRKGSVAKRLAQMASGKTMRRLMNAGLTDADARHRPTYPASRPFVQLDHIMLSQHLAARNVELLPRSSSDHLGILAEVDV